MVVSAFAIIKSYQVFVASVVTAEYSKPCSPLVLL